MKIAPVADIKARFSSYLDQCEESPIIVTKNGRPVALLVSIQEEEELERMVLAHTPKFRQLLAAAEERIRQKGGIKHQDFWKRVKSRKKAAAKNR